LDDPCTIAGYLEKRPGQKLTIWKKGIDDLPAGNTPIGEIQRSLKPLRTRSSILIKEDVFFAPPLIEKALNMFAKMSASRFTASPGMRSRMLVCS